MRATLEQVEKEITELTSAERFYLLEKLVRDAHNAIPPQTDERWYEEAKAREEAVAAGKLETLPWHQVKQDARKLL